MLGMGVCVAWSARQGKDESQAVGANTGSSHDPKKPAPDLIRGGNRFSKNPFSEKDYTF
jgi:hypothetical protein